MQGNEDELDKKGGGESSCSLPNDFLLNGTRNQTDKPITIAPNYAEAPRTLEDMHEQLDLILGACAQLEDLRGSYLPVTQREVTKLRKAFWLAVGETEKLNRSLNNLGVEQNTVNLHSADTDNSHSGHSRRYDTQEHLRHRLSKRSSVPSDRSLQTSTKNDVKAIACDRALQKLEEYVSGHPDAQTFDDTENPKGWRFFAIPLQRRLQTLVVSLCLFFTLLPLSFLLTIFLMINWWTMPFLVMYVVYMFTIGKPKHPVKKSSWFAKLKFWCYYRDYFPVRLVIPRYVRRQFDSTKNYIFVYHPHGIHAFGAIINFSADANNISSLLPDIQIHVQTLKVNFYIPFWREAVLMVGSGDASRQCISKTLRAGPGESVLLIVGGAKESLLAKPYTNELTLRERKGFVKIALEEGSPLVPVYAFGENDVYRIPRMVESAWYKRVSVLFKKVTTFAIPLVMGRGWFNYGFGVLPHRRPIVVVVGEPLEVPKIPKPTPEDILEWHDKYVAALLRVFNEHRGIYDMESTGLRVVQ